MVGSPDVPFYQWNSSSLVPPINPEEQLQKFGAPTLQQILSPMATRVEGIPTLPAGGGVLAPDFQHLAGDVAAPGQQPGLWGNFFKGMVGTKDSPGWGGLALGGANSLLQGYLGMRQYALAKKQLAEGQRQFNLNYANQVKLTNAQLEDRQRARVATGNSGYESTDAYMAKNRI